MRLLSLGLAGALLLVPATSAGQSGEASKTPEQILADVTRDLGAVHTYHLTAKETTRTATGSVVGDVDASGPMRIRVHEGAEQYAIVITASATFVKASRAFWRQEAHVKSAKALKLLANRWIKIPASQDVRALVAQFAPTKLAQCLSSDHGTLAKRGTTTFGGLHVIVLADKGDKPGSTPALL